MEFFSVFKIEEKPILRPCLSDDKREEMRRFKAKALEIERRFVQSKKNATLATQTEFQGKTEKFDPFVLDMENCSIHSEYNTDNDIDNDNLVTSISEWDVSSIPGNTTDHDVAISLCSRATDPCCNQGNNNGKPGQYDHNDVKTPLPLSIIRSDSFIVDEPSECFLKQMEDNGVVPINSISLTDLSIECNPTKIMDKQSIKRKTEIKKITTPKLKKYPPKLFGIKKSRSDNISNLPEKVIRKSQVINVSDVRKERLIQKPIVSIHQTRKPQAESTFTQTVINEELSIEQTIDDRIAEVVANIEEKYRSEVVLFLEKQKREQDAFLRKVMSQVKARQDSFQYSLVMQIKTMMDDCVSKLNNRTNTSDTSNTSTLNDLNGNFPMLESKGADYNKFEINQAATKINAFARGYLTRRLFKVESVQQIAKLIHDSRNLVVDIHSENTGHESVADIQMKHNLLQQLLTNSLKLSEIFVKKTIMERMSMIATDRQVIKHRFQQSKISNNKLYETPPFHEREYMNQLQDQRSKSLKDKLKKLKIVELFSDSIPGDIELACSNQGH